MKRLIYIGVLFAVAINSFFSCRDEYEIIEPETIQVTLPEYTSIEGFYLLNEGNMGSNKATLDYFDYTTGEYTRNIFGAANPHVVKEMGDVGNDLKIYGNKLYAVINRSGKVDVMDAQSVVKTGQVDIPNCRFIAFKDGYAYVTSYAGPVQTGPNYEQLGFVAKIDTVSLQEVDRCLVGYQPDELAIVGNRMYVANSGGYNAPDYDNTVSVIDLNTFTEVKKIEVVRNPYRVRVDRYGQLWVSSRGDYYGQPSKLFCIDLRTETVVDSLDIGVSNMHLDGDSLYICSTEWSYNTLKNEVTYGIVNVKDREVVTRNFITDGSEKSIRIPFGITVNPLTKDIYVTDARNYVSAGILHCYSPQGVKKWSVATGDIPAHFAFKGEMKH
jgi:Uncharacterized conserved protein